MTYRIKGRRAAQQDHQQPTQMTRQYTAGSMAINAGVAQPGSPGSPFIGLKPKDEPLGWSAPRLQRQGEQFGR